MPSPSFNGLKSRLLDGGVAPEYVERAIEELREHYEDIEADALAAGLSPASAAARARAQLGSGRRIAAAVFARPELKTWSKRWPRTACCLESAALLVVLPAAPFVYCAYRKGLIARWGLSTGLALFVTAVLLLCMQSLISISGV